MDKVIRFSACAKGVVRAKSQISNQGDCFGAVKTCVDNVQRPGLFSGDDAKSLHIEAIT